MEIPEKTSSNIEKHSVSLDRRVCVAPMMDYTLTGAAHTGLQWLADRSEGWSGGYRLARWISLRATLTLNG